MNIMKKTFFVMLCGAAVLLTAPASAWMPNKRVEIVVPSGPDGASHLSLFGLIESPYLWLSKPGPVEPSH